MAVGLREHPITDYYPAGFRRDRNLPEDQWVKWFCLHVPVFPERMDGAERIARYFQGPEATARPASTAFCTDPDSCIRCIPDSQYGASAKGINRQGIHVEMTGYADQTKAEWMDAYSVATMEITAELFALYHREYGLPIKFVRAAGLKRGERGITTHAEAWKAFGGDYRSDPGPNFPMDYFLQLCRIAVSEVTGEMMTGIDFVKKGDGTDRQERPAVRYWQRILRTMGAYRGALDGIYGQGTEEAVAAVCGTEGDHLKDKEAFRIHRAFIRHEIQEALER